jgi:hypothetical protein
MGTFLAVAVAYIVGAKTGDQNFDEIVRSLNAIRESEEFRDLVAVVRSHAGDTLRAIAGMVDQHQVDEAASSDLVERVMRLVGRDQGAV